MSDKKDRKRERRWYLDVSGYSSTAVARSHDLPMPFSCVKHNATDQSRKENAVDQSLIAKRSWEVALGPIKQVPMNLFVMWMAGNSISLFPIMMVGMMAVRPVQALFNLSPTFKMIEGDQAILQKATYIFGNLVAMGLAVYKCNSMGLLPTHASDWLTFAEPQQRLEYVAGGLSLQ